MKKITYFLNSHHQFITVLFFSIIIFIGLFTYKDYGLSWDEPTSHVNGRVTLSYLTDNDPFLWEYSERYYGVVVELPLAIGEKFFDVNSPQELFFFRHLATFFLFVVGTFFFYKLCSGHLQSRWWGLLGAAMLVLSPRIFADAFYNSKDIPLMVFFIIGTYTLTLFLKKPTWKTALWHALATALAVATRIPGIFIVALTLGIFLLDLIFFSESRRKWRQGSIYIGGYLLGVAGCTVALWPFLWKAPWAHFMEAFTDMSQFSRQVGMQVLYLGNFETASKLPWHYIPVWVAITTPLSYLGLFLIGVWAIFKNTFHNFKSWYIAHRVDIVMLGWFIGPIVSVILFRSVLYDGWRHLYFIYPAVIFIALKGLHWLFHMRLEIKELLRRFFRPTLGILIGGSLVLVLARMVADHPYQQVYFNPLAGGIARARDQFDLDYWGLSFREGLEYIAAHDSDNVIPVFLAGGSLDNTLILSPEIARRFKVLTQEYLDDAKYVVSNYRWQRYRQLPFQAEVYSVKVQGESILSVFKVR